jgi:hypothetical protein
MDDPHTVTPRPASAQGTPPEDPLLSDQLAAWLDGDGDKTFGGLVEVFEKKSFALLFILLLGVSALPIPTGGATHVFDIIAVLVAGQLVAGRDEIWIPRRWRGIQIGGGRQQRFIDALMKVFRFLERFSRPRLTFLFDHRLSNVVFGVVVILLTVAAFVAPPFSGLDTLPGLGVVLISLGVLLEDALIVAIGLAAGIAGVLLEIVLGKAALSGIGKLF